MAKRTTTRTKKTPTTTSTTIAPELRHEWIATAAYYRAERNGFQGDPTENWLAAEAELRAQDAAHA